MATVTWEDCDQPARDIFFETEEEFASYLGCNADAFLTACVMPAMYHGEKRIWIKEEICPELRRGLYTAMEILQTWHKAEAAYQVVRIEADLASHPAKRGIPRFAGSFMSGGIDSVALLRMNRLDIPTGHPASIKDCLTVYGFDIGGYELRPGESDEKAQHAFQNALGALHDMAQDAGVSIVPVYTNIKHLKDDNSFWTEYFHGAALSAVAHAFSNRFYQVSIASSDTVSYLVPWGSHPVLDPNYSSADLVIKYVGVTTSRFEKTRVVAGWDAALQNIRVCTLNVEGLLNCGRCEKCVRTMVALIALEKLEQCHAFATSDVSPELLKQLDIIPENLDAFYRDMIVPLKERNRPDLAKVIEDKIVRAEESDWKGLVKKLDRQLFKSSLYRAWGKFRA